MQTTGDEIKCMWNVLNGLEEKVSGIDVNSNKALCIQSVNTSANTVGPRM